MEFKFNVQADLFCNKEGFSQLKLEHILREEYENTDKIVEVLSKLRNFLAKVIILSFMSKIGK